MRDLVLDLDLDLILAVVWILREGKDDLYDDTEKNDLELIQGEVNEQALWTGRLAMRRIDVGKVTCGNKDISADLGQVGMPIQPREGARDSKL